eukprot:NODE_184_length_15718_cov_0.161342.p14 type:complete len:101 gc:universal NODE_184_length_15718_cov_0.161342:10138-10440(+)
MAWTVSSDGLLFKYLLNNKHAKSQCSPSSRLINSLLKVRPGMNPRFLSQKIDANDPLKKIPSIAANATSRSPKVFPLLIHRNAQSAFFLIQGIVSILLNK